MADEEMKTVDEEEQETKTVDEEEQETINVDEEEKKAAQAAAAQIEFYFADANLPYDKFMWTLYTADPVNHWVPLATVTSFKRMREHTAKGMPFIIAALRTYAASTLELDDTATNIRRIAPVTEPKNLFDRSIYAKGFPLDTTQDQLEAFFKKWAPVDAVRMRRDAGKSFKGSVFVEWKEFDSVKHFLEAEPKPSWEDKELLIMTKEAYCDMKIKEKGLSGKAADSRKDYLKTKGFNAFREMAAAASSSKTTTSSHANTAKEAKPKPEIVLEFMGVRIPVIEDKDGHGTIDESAVPTVEGATLKFVGCGGDVTWSGIKDPLKERFPRPPYIKYSRGDDHGYVGFSSVLTEEDIAFVKENIKTLNSNDITWDLADSEESKSVLIERAKFAARAALASQSPSTASRGGRGGGRGNSRGGRGGRGGGRDRDSDSRGGRGGRGRGGRGRGRGGDRNAERAEGDRGEKRKRAVEPEGGPDAGVRGTTGPPVIGSSSKKVKVDEA